MIKVPVTYQNLDDEDVTIDLWFHISKDEIIATIDSDAEDALLPTLMRFQRLIENDEASGLDIMKAMRLIIAKAYCEREGDGIKEKTEEASNKFLRSLAFDALLDKLILDPKFAQEFVGGIFPRNLEEIAEAVGGKVQPAGKVIKDAEVKSIGLVPVDDRLSGLRNPRDPKGNLWPWAFREPTNPELGRMNRAQLLEVMQRQSSDWTPPPQVESVKPV